MVALTTETLILESEEPVRRPGHRISWRGLRVWRFVVLACAGLYFLLPLYSALRFALTTSLGHFSWSGFTSIPSDTGFTTAITLSLELAAVTMVITLALMVPTTIYVHLKFPRLLPIFDGITLLPIGIPPIVLILGVLQTAPFTLKSTPYLLSLEYVILAMPFAFRSLDAGLRAIDSKTLVEASRSLGGKWLPTLWRVVMPNLRAGLLSATVLTLALVLGEFTMASLDLQTTFPVWLAATDQKSAQISTAASFLALALTWVLLLVISSFDRRQYQRRARLAKEPS